MKLSEELQWRGFVAEHTLDQISDLDKAPRNFYWGTDPSADSLHIGHLAALMMCACFVRHGYTPYYLVGGATGQIGDPKIPLSATLKASTKSTKTSTPLPNKSSASRIPQKIPRFLITTIGLVKLNSCHSSAKLARHSA